MDIGKVLARMMVIVADDEQFSRAIVLRMVRELGAVDAEPVRNGEEGLVLLAQARDKAPLLIADFNMPRCNGLQMLKAIRAGRAFVANDMPVIMLTGYSDFALVRVAMALDVDAFVVKPVSKATLSSRIEKILGETRDIKPAEQYAEIDIESVCNRMIRNEPLGRPLPPAPKKVASGAIQVKLEDVPEGVVLGDDIRTKDGELLLAAGHTLNARFLRRLRELKAVTKIEFLTILPPAK
ncbi:MAG: response regulator [Magnetospirillum sp.]|nr:MAG: response regulator [Magnetospirillum sp.]